MCGRMNEHILWLWSSLDGESSFPSCFFFTFTHKLPMHGHSVAALNKDEAMGFWKKVSKYKKWQIDIWERADDGK